MRVLLTVCRLAYYPERILAAVYRLAPMGIEFGLNIGTFELGVAPFADAKVLLYNPQFALGHDCSLAQC
jgi:hypothetical protein